MYTIIKLNPFRYNTYKGTMRMYIQAIRAPSGQVVLNAKMLKDNEDGLGEEENNPPVIIAADVNCDTITLTVGNKIYKIDYNFGRSGAKDLGEIILMLRFLLFSLFFLSIRGYWQS